jgi:hypothetical protein
MQANIAEDENIFGAYRYVTPIGYGCAIKPAHPTTNSMT